MNVIKNIFRKKNNTNCSIIVPAAGSSARMNGENKLFMNICGASVLKRTLSAIDQSELINEIIIPTRADMLEKVSQICSEAGMRKPVKVIIGGESRLESVYAGLLECSSSCAYVAIHDAARPLVKPEEIDRIIRECFKTNAVIPAVPVVDTIKSVDDNIVKDTPDRAKLVAVQTPQVFHADIIKAALTNAIKNGISVTDDSSAVEMLGKKVYIIDGDSENIKITTPFDIMVAEAILNHRSANE